MCLCPREERKEGRRNVVAAAWSMGVNSSTLDCNLFPLLRSALSSPYPLLALPPPLSLSTRKQGCLASDYCHLLWTTFFQHSMVKLDAYSAKQQPRSKEACSIFFYLSHSRLQKFFLPRCSTCPVQPRERERERESERAVTSEADLVAGWAGRKTFPFHAPQEEKGDKATELSLMEAVSSCFKQQKCYS
jgi:hypothetical protein